MRSQTVLKEKSIEYTNIEEATIVSFDIPQNDKSARSIIQRYLHGRTERRNVNGEDRTYRYPGLLDEGGFRLGQSVYFLPPDLASRLILKLREQKISHRYWDVMVPG